MSAVHSLCQLVPTVPPRGINCGPPCWGHSLDANQTLDTSELKGFGGWVLSKQFGEHPRGSIRLAGSSVILLLVFVQR